MKKTRAENSTQRLLDYIRSGAGNNPPPVSQGDAAVKKPASTRGDARQWPGITKSLRKRNLTLGVWIDNNDVIMVLVSGNTLLKWRSTPIPDTVNQEDSAGFSPFLGQCLDTFLEGEKRLSVWCALDSSKLKIKQLTIPDLPAAKIPNAAFWAFKRDADFHESLDVFDFDMLGDTLSNGLKRKRVLAFSVPKSDISAMKTLFAQAGYPLSGITAIPFAMQNYIRTGQIRVSGSFFGLVNISSYNSEVFCFSSSGILLVRSLRTGSLNLVEEIPSIPDQDAVAYLSALTEKDFSEAPVIKETSERLISKIMRTGDYCAQNYTDNTPLERYLFFGDTDMCTPFMNMAASMIPAQVDAFDPFGTDPARAAQAPLPERADQRNAVLTAFGIGLSANGHTPNFLFTCSDRQMAGQQQKIFLTAVTAGVLLLLSAISSHSYFISAHKKNMARLDRIRAKQADIGFDMDTHIMARAVARADERNKRNLDYIDTYRILAVLYEISRLTPEHIRLAAVSFGRDIKGTNKKGTDKKDGTALVLEGRVSSSATRLSTELGSYIFSLSESPVFGDIDILEKQAMEGSEGDGQARLKFKALLEVL